MLSSVLLFTFLCFFNSALSSNSFDTSGSVIVSNYAATAITDYRIDLFARNSYDFLYHCRIDTTSGALVGADVVLGPPNGKLTSAPAVVSTTTDDCDERIDVFVRGEDNGIWHLWWGQYNWDSLGAVSAGAPTATGWTNRFDVFVKGMYDNALWHTWWDGSWHGWTSLGGSLDSDPSAVSMNVGRIDVFARSTSGQLVQIFGDGNTWSTWISLDYLAPSEYPHAAAISNRIDIVVKSNATVVRRKSWMGTWTKWYTIPIAKTNLDPAIVADTKFHDFHLFTVGTDGKSYRSVYTDKSSMWGDYIWIGNGTCNSSLAVSSWAPNRLDLFVRGPTAALMHRFSNDGGVTWTGWENLGGVIKYNPAAVSWGLNRIDIFAIGTDNALWHRWYDGNWRGWESLGGTFTSAPTVASWSVSYLDIFVKGTDNALWHKRYNGVWNAWEIVGIPILASYDALGSGPSAVSWGLNRLDLFARKADGELGHRYWDSTYNNNFLEYGIHLYDAENPIVGSYGVNHLVVLVKDATYSNVKILYCVNDSFSDWSSLGGALAYDPAIVSDAYGRLRLFIVGKDGNQYQKNFYDTSLTQLVDGETADSKNGIAFTMTSKVIGFSVGIALLGVMIVSLIVFVVIKNRANSDSDGQEGKGELYRDLSTRSM